jgi:uncharacterized protein YggE
MRQILALAFLPLLVLPLSAQAEESPPIIAVWGEGEVAAAPDMAIVTLGARAEAGTAQEAMAQSSAGVSATLAVLEAAGVEPRDIQTSGLSLSPRWVRPEDRDGPSEVDGYVASNTLTIRVRDLDDLGEILDAAVSQGANSLGGISFGLSDPDAAEEAARRDAVADARDRAGVFAEAAGVTLGALQSLSDESGGGSAPVMMMRAEAMSDSAVPVAAGELTVSARVRVVYAIAE